jgi:hypothetical protein
MVDSSDHRSPAKSSHHNVHVQEKPFPLRDQHFFTSVDKAMADLDWKPEFGLLDGLKDSYSKDFGRGTFRKAADFTCDDMILAKAKGKVLANV